MGTSLWIVPNEQDAERLKTLMRRTRQNERADFPSSYPAFHPHVTLASFPSASTSTSAPSTAAIRAALDSALHGADNPLPNPRPRPIQIAFESLELGTHFFRSVYIAAAPTPALRALHGAVHAGLGVAPRTPAFPHLSLCYVGDADAEERGRFWGEVRVRVRGGCEHGGGDGEGGRVSIWCGEEGGWVAGFEAGEVWVVECDGPVEGWTVLDKISIV
ncbi:hypothetical protein C0993_010455 [Termitomyces sp. T159_Od127]|nr:hypothetical protein C0993_010455 [Termitomyces sp. T159_Od127]